MSTARDIIKGSLRLIGALASGETPAADEQADALSVLNDMVDSWSVESLMIPNLVRESFTLVPGQGTYTMGPLTGDFVTSRPVSIEKALIQVVGTSPAFETPVKILNLDQWINIEVKSTQSSLPIRLYAEGTSPLETINLWPVPDVANVLVLYSWKLVASFANASDVLTLPPGYAKALRYNLALELAPEYGKEPSGMVVAQAVQAKAVIKRINSQTRYLSVDDALLGRVKTFNYLTGE